MTQVDQGGTWMGSKQQQHELQHLDVVGPEDRLPGPIVRLQLTYFLNCLPLNYKKICMFIKTILLRLCLVVIQIIIENVSYL